MLATANFGEHLMPRYFFNVVQAGHVYRDDIGQEFANESAALEEARKYLQKAYERPKEKQ